ncbi:hypothetical protein QWY99_22020 [Flavobacterium branchiarum]|uniref:Uncharacterized protein n=1 Tax=Flavobacterium branchiarum TaxID=1114870 RepID=A0ABV5FJ27_9FLAO|nr:hypothetical protein [Flavobacterium branchiarum]MDN3675714.1 hypothetical protein [Flavobacterium branchiarum]
MEKKVTHYFVYVGHSNATKNKLQDEFENYLKSLSATIIEVNKLEDLKSEIINKSLELNEIHRRCQGLKISIVDMHYSKGFMISGFHSLVFQILKGYGN